MKLQAVSNRKLYLQIADQIRDQILSGAVAPGRQLPSERDLALTLGVSRPTVREALIALEVAGLVEVRIGVGAFVKGPEEEEAELPEDLTSPAFSPLEVMAVRRLLEPQAAALASQNITSAERAKLTETIGIMRDETARNEWTAESDRSFHMTIAEGSGNQVLRELLWQLWESRSKEVDRQFHQHLADIDGVRDHIIADHEAIFSAILSGNEAQARAAMAAHLEYAETCMLGVWD